MTTRTHYIGTEARTARMKALKELAAEIVRDAIAAAVIGIGLIGFLHI